jgi:hypothetical protein
MLEYGIQSDESACRLICVCEMGLPAILNCQNCQSLIIFNLLLYFSHITFSRERVFGARLLFLCSTRFLRVSFPLVSINLNVNK